MCRFFKIRAQDRSLHVLFDVMTEAWGEAAEDGYDGADDDGGAEGASAEDSAMMNGDDATAEDGHDDVLTAGAEARGIGDIFEVCEDTGRSGDAAEHHDTPPTSAAAAEEFLKQRILELQKLGLHTFIGDVCVCA